MQKRDRSFILEKNCPYRCFTAAQRKDSRRNWATTPIAADLWTLGAQIGRGEAGSFHQVHPIKALARFVSPPSALTVRRGRHIKQFAADLALALKLPVQAVCLWTAPDGGQFGVSAWAFPQALTWAEVATRLSATFMQNAAPTFSAARVFHSWIGDTDHNGNAGNVVVDVTSADDRRGRLHRSRFFDQL